MAISGKVAIDIIPVIFAREYFTGFNSLPNSFFIKFMFVFFISDTEKGPCIIWYHIILDYDTHVKSIYVLFSHLKKLKFKVTIKYGN